MRVYQMRYQFKFYESDIRYYLMEKKRTVQVLFMDSIERAEEYPPHEKVTD